MNKTLWQGKWSLAMQKQGGVIEGLPAEACTHCLNATASYKGTTTSWWCPQGKVSQLDICWHSDLYLAVETDNFTYVSLPVSYTHLTLPTKA